MLILTNKLLLTSYSQHDFINLPGYVSCEFMCESGSREKIGLAVVNDIPGLRFIQATLMTLLKFHSYLLAKLHTGHLASPQLDVYLPSKSTMR